MGSSLHRCGAGPALAPADIDDAVASLAVTLTEDEVSRLEATYTPRVDYQGMSNPAMLAKAIEAATGFKVSA